MMVEDEDVDDDAKKSKKTKQRTVFYIPNVYRHRPLMAPHVVNKGPEDDPQLPKITMFDDNNDDDDGGPTIGTRPRREPPKILGRQEKAP